MDTVYQQKIYQGNTVDEIKQSIITDGFAPLLIKNHAGYVYPAHSHIETKLLVFLEGTMIVRVGRHIFQCAKGDKLIIPGNVVHEATVGKEGCEFFWSEKILDL